MANSVEERTGRLLCAKALTLAVAESCTGGLLGSRLTDVPGSSRYFLGGIVVYANEAKVKLLHVDRAVLGSFGAVSGECALAMARGAREAFGADVALATTGIAGPKGGTPDKPVGLVFISLVSANGMICERHRWSGDRIEVKRQTVDAALALLERYLVGVS